MSLEILQPYFLAGGTALALQLGHRMSYDLDFFGKIKLDYISLSDELRSLGSLLMLDSEEQAYRCEINNIKVDIVNYKSLSLIKPLVVIEGLRLASVEDIATMKIKTLEDRGYKRDFYDLYSLLEVYSLEHLLDLTEQKFPETNRLHTLRCLVDFADAEDQAEPNMLNFSTDWGGVQDKIRTAVKSISL
jgi:predicted nucleotidyltransferase component of viral defense system